MTRLRLALDWTPNTLHTGFFVARHQGYLAEANLELEIISADADGYATTPAKKVELGEADLAIAPSESVISFQTKAKPAPLKAIAALLAKDGSAVVVQKSSGIERPAQLDGKIYASYAARFEDHIVKRMVQADGGTGSLWITYPHKLGIWELFGKSQADATWVFMPWEGVESEQLGFELRPFRLGDYGIPYGYSPVLIAHGDQLARDAAPYQALVAAVRRGYHFALENPDEASRMLQEEGDHPTLADLGFLQKSQRSLADYLTAEGQPWGHMDPEVWHTFVHWLMAEGILTDHEGLPITELDIDQLFVAGW